MGSLRATDFRYRFVEEHLLGLLVKGVGDTIAGIRALMGQHPVNPFSGKLLTLRESFEAQFSLLPNGLAPNLAKLKTVVARLRKLGRDGAEAAARTLDDFLINLRQFGGRGGGAGRNARSADNTADANEAPKIRDDKRRGAHQGRDRNEPPAIETADLPPDRWAKVTGKIKKRIERDRDALKLWAENAPLKGNGVPDQYKHLGSTKEIDREFLKSALESEAKMDKATVDRVQLPRFSKIDDARIYSVDEFNWDFAPYGTIDPARVGTGQAGINAKTRLTLRNKEAPEILLDELVAGLKNGQIKPENLQPIQLYAYNGRIITADHRRVVAGRLAGVNLRYRIATENEVADAFARKFDVGKLPDRTVHYR